MADRMSCRIDRTLAYALLLVTLFVAAAPTVALALTDEDIASLAYADPATTAGSAATNSGGPELLGILGRMGLALGIVFGLMWLVMWAARRYMPQVTQSRRGGAIEVLGSRSIGARRSLMLVRAQGRTLLLGVTPQSIQTLAELDDAGQDWQRAAWSVELDDEPVSAPPSKSGATTTLERL